MKQIYLAHPLSATTAVGIKRNLTLAKQWYKWACDHYWPEHTFNCMWILNCEVYDDADAIQRSRGMQRNLAHIKRCDELWLLGEEVSVGMLEEALFAQRTCKMPVYDLTGFEAPPNAKISPVSMTKWRNGLSLSESI